LFNKLLTAAKLRRVRFHDLRHTFASLLIEQGESLVYVRDQMGHSSMGVRRTCRKLEHIRCVGWIPNPEPNTSGRIISLSLLTDLLACSHCA
jgi:hypothetical protein